jgi:hypothetical protein
VVTQEFAVSNCPPSVSLTTTDADAALSAMAAIGPFS